MRSPTEALDRGIATVFQDLAVVPIMPVYRNFFLGREPTRGWGPFRRLDFSRAISVAAEALQELGVAADAVRRPIGTLVRWPAPERRRRARRAFRRAKS